MDPPLVPNRSKRRHNLRISPLPPSNVHQYLQKRLVRPFLQLPQHFWQSTWIARSVLRMGIRSIRYGEIAHRRSLKGGASGAIELHSRDDGNDQNVLSVNVSSLMSPRREGSREFILDPNDHVTKTVVELKNEHRMESSI